MRVRTSPPEALLLLLLPYCGWTIIEAVSFKAWLEEAFGIRLEWQRV